MLTFLDFYYTNIRQTFYMNDVFEKKIGFGGLPDY
jgi:hypothetical protein